VPRTLKVEVKISLGRIVSAALPLNDVEGFAEAEEVGSAEPLKVMVVGPSSVIVDVRVLVL